MVASQIFDGAWSLLKLEHGHFSNFSGAWSFKKMNTSIHGSFLEPKKRVPP
jgi:hypothetical protein